MRIGEGVDQEGDQIEDSYLTMTETFLLLLFNDSISVIYWCVIRESKT